MSGNDPSKLCVWDEYSGSANSVHTEPVGGLWIASRYVTHDEREHTRADTMWADMGERAITGSAESELVEGGSVAGEADYARGGVYRRCLRAFQSCGRPDRLLAFPVRNGLHVP